MLNGGWFELADSQKHGKFGNTKNFEEVQKNN